MKWVREDLVSKRMRLYTKVKVLRFLLLCTISLVYNKRKLQYIKKVTALNYINVKSKMCAVTKGA